MLPCIRGEIKGSNEDLRNIMSWKAETHTGLICCSVRKGDATNLSVQLKYLIYWKDEVCDVRLRKRVLIV